MKTSSNLSTGNQLRWVVLLLAIAVILPTICLLWFMSQAVRNERLAVRQKLSVIYLKRLEILSKGIDELWTARIGIIEKQAALQGQPVEMFDRLVGHKTGTDDPNICNAVIIFDRSGKLVYPLTGGQDYPGEFSPEFNLAWNAEFIDEDFNRAIQLYEQFVNTADEGYYIHYSALLGKVRCLRKSGEIEKAAALCREMAYGQIPENVSVSSVALIARARILHLNMKGETQDGFSRSDLENLIFSSINYTPGSGNGFLLMPSDTRIFLL